MATLTTAFLPSKLNNPSLSAQQGAVFPHRRRLRKKNQVTVPVCNVYLSFFIFPSLDFEINRCGLILNELAYSNVV